MNNDFWSWVRWFANDFHEWKSLANRILSDKTKISHGNKCIILFLIHYLMSWTHTTLLNEVSFAHFTGVAEDNGLFWFSIVTSPQLI